MAIMATKQSGWADPTVFASLAVAAMALVIALNHGPTHAADRTYDLDSFMSECRKASAPVWESNCAGAEVTLDLFVAMVREDGGAMMRSEPAKAKGQMFNVAFAEVPEWGDDRSALEGRKARIVGTLGRKPTFAAAFVIDARFDTWLDVSEAGQAVQAGSNALDANRAMDASWRADAVALIKRQRPDVTQTAWVDETMLRLAMPPAPVKGQRRDDLARSFCEALTEAGKLDGNNVVVSIIDVRSLKTEQPVEIGIATCS